MQLSLNADTINAPLSAASLPRSHIPVTAANSSLSIKSVTDLPRADAMHQIRVHRALNGINRPSAHPQNGLRFRCLVNALFQQRFGNMNADHFPNTSQVSTGVPSAPVS
jgi:hypothetical protein